MLCVVESSKNSNILSFIKFFTACILSIFKLTFFTGLHKLLLNNKTYNWKFSFQHAKQTIGIHYITEFSANTAKITITIIGCVLFCVIYNKHVGKVDAVLSNFTCIYLHNLFKMYVRYKYNFFPHIGKRKTRLL